MVYFPPSDLNAATAFLRSSNRMSSVKPSSLTRRSNPVKSRSIVLASLMVLSMPSVLSSASVLPSTLTDILFGGYESPRDLRCIIHVAYNMVKFLHKRVV